MRYLDEVSPEVKRQVLASMNRDPASEQQDIDSIKEWMKKQPHLPEVLPDRVIGSFLRINKFSIEIAKKKIDMYFTMRTKMPQFYQYANPTSEEMLAYCDYSYFIPMPALLKESHRRLNIFRINESDADKFEPAKSFAWTLGVCEVRLVEDHEESDIYIADLKHCGLGHMTKLSPMLMKQINTLIEKVYTTRVTEIHFINCPSIVDRFLLIFKTIVSAKIAQRIHVHETMEDMYKVIPKESLPSDYGGTAPSLKELHEKLKKVILSKKDHFEHLDTLKVDEKLRIEPFNDDLLGFHGNFKQLAVD